MPGSFEPHRPVKAHSSLPVTSRGLFSIGIIVIVGEVWPRIYWLLVVMDQYTR
jgi:hypothetical protein